MSINKVFVTGNLTRDIDLSTTASGIHVGQFGIAVNDRKKNQASGEWEDVANFFDVVLFGSRANSLADRLTKGAKVAIEGKLHWSQWERDGQKRTKVEIIADQIELMNSKKNETPSEAVDSIYDDDIPF